MKSFTDHKKQLAGFEDVLETVQVLEKIAAGKLHALEDQSIKLASYTEVIARLMVRLEGFTSASFKTASARRAKDKPRTLLVVLSGDRGLVGDLWHRLYDHYFEAALETHDMLVIGAKAQALWPAADGVTHYMFADRFPTDAEVMALADKLSHEVQSGTYAAVKFLYPKPQSLTVYHPVIADLLPLAVDESVLHTKEPLTGFPIIEGVVEDYKQSLLKKYLLARLHQFLQETALAEFSARTVGLEHAGAKTETIIADTMRQYRRWRRHEDTAKQLERFSAISSL